MEGRKKQDLIWGDSKLNGDEFRSTERGSDHWLMQQTDCTRFKSLSSSEKEKPTTKWRWQNENGSFRSWIETMTATWFHIWNFGEEVRFAHQRKSFGNLQPLLLKFCSPEKFRKVFMPKLGKGSRKELTHTNTIGAWIQIT